MCFGDFKELALVVNRGRGPCVILSSGGRKVARPARHTPREKKNESDILCKVSAPLACRHIGMF